MPLFAFGRSLDDGVRRDAGSALGPVLDSAHAVSGAVFHSDILLQRNTTVFVEGQIQASQWPGVEGKAILKEASWAPLKFYQMHEVSLP